MSKVFQAMYETFLKDYPVKIPCRLCDEKWLLPKDFEEHFRNTHMAEEGKMICCWCKDWRPDDNGSLLPEASAQHKILCFKGYIILHLRHDLNNISQFIKHWNKGLAEPEKPIPCHSTRYRTQYKDLLEKCQVKLPCLECGLNPPVHLLPKDTEDHWAKTHDTKAKKICCWCKKYLYKRSDPPEEVARHKLECLKHSLYTYKLVTEKMENATIIRLIVQSNKEEEENEKDD